MASDNDKHVTFEELVAEIRTVTGAVRGKIRSTENLKWCTSRTICTASQLTRTTVSRNC